MTVFNIEDVGSIKVDETQQGFNAHCGCLPEHSTETMPECRLKRTMQKAPLAFLVCWLRLGRSCINRERHYVRRVGITLKERQLARAWLRQQPELRPLLEREAQAMGLSSPAEVVEPERAQ